MEIERTGEIARLTLTGEEVYLLRRALERASFIDTPVAEQPRIQEFCERLLGAIAGDAVPGESRRG